MAVTVGALTWWVLRGRDRTPVDWHGVRDTSWDRDMAGADEATLGEKVGETVGEYAESARTTARGAALRVREAAASARVQAQQRWQRASTSVDDWVHEYPLAAGALAVAVGAAIGLSVRSTNWEDRTMGGARDRALEKASRSAQELTNAVTAAPATPGFTDPTLGRA